MILSGKKTTIWQGRENTEDPSETGPLPPTRHCYVRDPKKSIKENNHNEKS